MEARHEAAIGVSGLGRHHDRTPAGAAGDLRPGGWTRQVPAGADRKNRNRVGEGAPLAWSERGSPQSSVPRPGRRPRPPAGFGLLRNRTSGRNGGHRHHRGSAEQIPGGHAGPAAEPRSRPVRHSARQRARRRTGFRGRDGQRQRNDLGQVREPGQDLRPQQVLRSA